MDEPGVVRILLVEDDPDDAFLVRRAMTEAVGGRFMFRLDHAKSLSEAVDRVRKEEYDVALLDLMLPDGQGLQTYLEFREAARRLPTVVITGFSDEGMGFRAIGMGAQDYLVKGTLSGRALRRSILYAIERSRLAGRMEAVLSGAPDGMVMVDPEGKILYANPAAERMLDRQAGEMVGLPFPWPVAAGRTSEVEFQAKGRARLLEMRVSRADWRGTSASLVTLRDVSEIKQIEQLGAAMREQRRQYMQRG